MFIRHRQAVQHPAKLLDQIDPRWRYSQVPAFSASDRAMIDVLTVTREGRLAVLELKANEDIHLPLQGIDYWSRVWLGITLVASFKRSDTLLGGNFRRNCRCW
jgi:hypothetical protein